MPTPSDHQESAITVVGHGAAAAAPDLMRVTISVESRGADVSAAYARASERAAAVVHSLRANGVLGPDVATTGLTVQSETVWEEGKGNRVVGYVANTSLAIALRDLSEDADPQPAAIIAASVDVGGDDVRLGGFELGVADQAALLAQARDSAWDDALAKARQYAGLSGRELGPVLDITEDVAPSGVRPVARMMKATAGAMPVERGESQLSVDVRIRWSLT